MRKYNKGEKRGSMEFDSRFLAGELQQNRQNGAGGRPKGGRHARYLRAQVETATPTQLILILYDGAIRFCSMALEAMEAKDLEEQNRCLKGAQAIICELMSSLNRESGGEVASNLMNLYYYLYSELIRANLQDETEVVLDVQKHLMELRESWAEVDKNARQIETGLPEQGEGNG